MKCYGHKYEVSVVAYYKVAMSHMNREDAENEAFLATDKLFDKEIDVKVIDSKVTGIERQKFFDVAEVEIDVRVNVTAHSYEAAYTDAENVIESVGLPVGVSLYSLEAYEYERGELAVGE